MSGVYVTGMGIVSALGSGIDVQLSALRSGTSGLKKARHFQSKYAEVFPFGEVDMSNSELAEQLGGDQTGLTRTDLLATLAADECLLQAGKPTCDAIISATTVGGMCLTQLLYDNASGNSDDTEYLDSYAFGTHTLKLAERYGIAGFTSTLNTACSSSLNAIILGTRLIRSGRAKRVLVGGTDSLAKFAVNGFNALQILSKTPCAPFDENRSGLTLGEGAAYLLLESEEAAGDRKKLAKILGYQNTNDAFHASSLSEEGTGVIAAMSGALENAGLNSKDIDAINAHGTGTENNDWVESLALTKVFESVPAYSSTKSYTGHTLGAAGAVETVFSILSLIHQEVYPSLGVTAPIPDFPIQPATDHQQKALSRIMTNSFGFAGNCSSLILESCT